MPGWREVGSPRWVMSPQARALRRLTAATPRRLSGASSRAGRERRAIYLSIGRLGLAPRFPSILILSLAMDDNGQTGNGAWQGENLPLPLWEKVAERNEVG